MTNCTCIVGWTGPDSGPCFACAPGSYKFIVGNSECLRTGDVDAGKIVDFMHVFNSKTRTGSLRGIVIHQDTVNITSGEQGDTLTFMLSIDTPADKVTSAVLTSIRLTLAVESGIEESRVAVRLVEHAMPRRLLDSRTRIQVEIKYGALPPEKKPGMGDAEYMLFINVGLVVLLGACVCMCLRAWCMNNHNHAPRVNRTRDDVFF